MVPRRCQNGEYEDGECKRGRQYRDRRHYLFRDSCFGGRCKRKPLKTSTGISKTWNAEAACQQDGIGNIQVQKLQEALKGLGAEPGCYTKSLPDWVTERLNTRESLMLDFHWVKLMAAQPILGIL